MFLGKVVFSDDDGSGTFVQRTFVHFDVQEVFKGLGAGVHDVWVDPGSFASCYAEYRRDERYLVFAYAGTRLPVGAPAMTTAPPGTKRKPLPVGVDAANPPVVYVAPECSGTLPIMQQSQSVVSAWLKDLKAYKKREEQSAANSHTEKHP